MSSIFGASSSKKAADEQARLLAIEKRKLEAERLRKMNEDFIDTSAGQNLVRQAKEAAKTLSDRAAGEAAVAGGTTAASAVAKEQANKMVGDTIANIAAQDTARKDNIDASYRQGISQLKQQEMAMKGAQAQATAQAAGAASSGLLSMAGAAFGGTKLGQSWFGTTPNAKAAQTINPTGQLGDYEVPNSVIPTVHKYVNNYWG
jgi:hypothetical protein